MFKLGQCVITIILGVLSTSAHALTFYGIDKDVVGEIKTTTVRPGDTLGSIGRQYDIGQIEMVEANPHLNRHSPKVGAKVIIPSKFVLPPGERNGIVLNLPELRMYVYLPDKNIVKTFPMGIGRNGWSTPLRKTTITERKKDPTWTPPKSIRNKYLRLGKTLPAVIPAGPNNPLGQYALRLNIPGFLIHGTNHPETVGYRSSHGCIRMFPEDIKELYDTVAVKTPVNIIHAPYKMAKFGNRIYFEAHEPLEGPQYSGKGVDLKMIVQNLSAGDITDTDWTAIEKAALETTGYPSIID